MDLTNIVQNAAGGAVAPMTVAPGSDASDPIHGCGCGLPDCPVCGAVDAPDPGKMIPRDPPYPSEERLALVKRWSDRVKRGKKHFEPVFKQMREDMKFLKGDQWGNEAISKEKYTANLVQRHVQQKVSALYAKNPTAECSRRRTLDFAVWDETDASLMAVQTAMQVQQQAAATGQMTQPNPQAAAILQDFLAGTQKRKMLDKVAKTTEIVFRHSMDEQQPPFKQSMKQLVRRTISTGIGYVKIGYQRFMEKRPEDIEKITDATQRLATLERLIADMADGEIEAHQAEAEQLRLLIADLEQHPDMITKEGLVFDFPSSTSIIPDPNCKHLRGFVGAQWVAQEFVLTTDDVKEQYGVDLSASTYTKYEESGKLRTETPESSGDKASYVCVWEIYSKRDGLLYVVADGYKDFLIEPAEPSVKLERFWPFFALAFNEIENEESIFPQSDVTLLRPMQIEYNRSREGLREHRHAARPMTAAVKGQLDDEDKMKLENHPANAVIELNALAPGDKIENVLQPIRGPGIDPNLYETGSVFQDIERVSGSQQANLGGVSGGTATEANIAEASRNSAIGSNVDDLDDLLSELFRSCGQVLFQEMSAETVRQIVGPGAVWPELSVNEIARELILDVQAGSSGRPNKAAEIQNFQLLAPILMQIPGVSPVWMARQAVMRMDDRIDPTDALESAAQSIVAMNGAQSAAVPPGVNDPGAQGAHGGDNAPRPSKPAVSPQQPGQPLLPHGGDLQTRGAV